MKNTIYLAKKDVNKPYSQENWLTMDSPTVIVAAITSRFLKKKSLPTHVSLESHVLEKNSQALLEQIRTIDRCRLIRKVGRITKDNMMEIEKSLKVSLALEKNRNEQQLYSTN